MNTKIARIVSLVLTLCLLVSCAATLVSCSGLGSLEFQSISVDKTTIVTEYTVGDEVDLSGIKVTVRYNDSTQTARVGFDQLKFEYDGKEITDFSVLTETAGEKILTVKYYDGVADKAWKSATVTVTVNELIIPEFVSIALRAGSVPATLRVGDRVDFSSILADVVYQNTDSNERTLTFSDLTLEYAEDLTATAGVKTVVVKYFDDVADHEEKSTSFTVTVGYPTFAAFTAQDAPTECYIGETVDFSNVFFSLTYAEGEAYGKTVLASAVTFSALDTATAGVKTVTVTYTDLYGFERSTSFKITVKNPEKVGLSVEANSITTLYGVGDTPDFGEIVAHATYSKSSFDRDLAFSDLTFTVGEDGALDDLTDVEGDKVVTVSYTDAYGNVFTTTVNVTVELRFVSFSIVQSSVVLTYYKDDAYDFSGIQATIAYNNASYNTTVSADDLTVTGIDDLTATLGEKTVTVTYADPKFDNAQRTATLKVSVVADGFKSVTLVTDDVKTVYAIGDTIDLTGLSFTTDYENNELDGTFAYTDARISLSSLEGLTASAGNKTIEVTYDDGEGTVKTMELAITVSAPVYQSASVNLNGFATSYQFGDTVPAYTAVTVSTVYDNAYCNGTVANKDLTFTGTVNMTKSGSYTVTVSFKDYNGTSRSTSFAITVTAPVYDAANTAIDMNGVKTAYYVSDTADNFASVKVNTAYDISSYDKVLSGSDLTVTNNVNVAKAGTYTVTVKFNDVFGTQHTLIYQVTVTAPAVKKAEATVGKDLYKKGDTVDFSDLKLTLTYDPAAYSKVLSGKDLTYSTTGITATDGKKNVEISYVDPYTGATAKAYLSITVASGVVDPFEAPDSLNKRNAYVTAAGKAAYGEAGFESQFFAGQDTTYYIGDDNEFIFKPGFALFDYESQQIENATLLIDTAITLDGTALTKVKGTAQNTYDYYKGETLVVTANISKYSYQFTADAVGKTVTLSLSPNSSVYTYTGAPVTLTAKVIDAYNVYSGKDLCVIDNVPTEEHGVSDYGVTQNWDTFKEQNGYAGVSVNGVVLQNDIILKETDLPETFFSTVTADITVYSTDAGGNPVQTVIPAGSKMLNDGLDIYMRRLENGERFTIEGNYFTLDAEKFPTIPTTGMKNSVSSGIGYESDFSNTTFFRFQGNAWEGIDKTSFSAAAAINNLSIKGNANRNENKDKDDYLVSAGGLILEKNTNCRLTFTNTITRCFFITYFPDDCGYDFTDETVTNVNYSKCYDSFQNAAFLWGNATLNADHSYVQRCGGPLAILQHVYPNENPTARIPKMNASDSVLESYVDSQAFWFNAVYATEQAQNIAALSGVLSAYGLGSYVNGQNKMNFVALVMSNGTNAADTITNLSASGTVTIEEGGSVSAVLDRTTSTAVGQTIRHMYANNAETLAKAPIFAAGDGTTAAGNILIYNGTCLTHNGTTALDPQSETGAGVCTSYASSSYVTLNFGGFGMMFSLAH